MDDVFLGFTWTLPVGKTHFSPCADDLLTSAGPFNRELHSHGDVPLSQATVDAAKADVESSFLAVVDIHLYLNRAFSCRVHLKIYNEQTNSIYKKTETMIRMFLTETGVKNVVL